MATRWLKKHFPSLLWVIISSCGSNNEKADQLTHADEFQLFGELPPERSNVLFENTIIENSRINILNYLYYYNGSGVAVGDINRDGLPDIYFAATVGKNRLFLNQGNLQFQKLF